LHGFEIVYICIKRLAVTNKTSDFTAKPGKALALILYDMIGHFFFEVFASNSEEKGEPQEQNARIKIPAESFARFQNKTRAKHANSRSIKMR
jgi:hypothetical protein